MIAFFDQGEMDQMSVHFFAIRIETHRLVAAEVHDRAAAALLDAGQQILLGTVEELGKLAARLQRPLVTISCAPTRAVPRCSTAITRVSRPEPSSAATEPRTRPAQGEDLFPMSASPASSRSARVPAVGVA